MIINDCIFQNKQAKKLRRVVFISHFVQISLMSGLIKKTAVSHTYFCITSQSPSHIKQPLKNSRVHPRQNEDEKGK